MVQIDKKCVYTCEITSDEDNTIPKPLYKVTAADDQENPITANSSTACWVIIIKRVCVLRQSNRKTLTVSGPERFGLTDPYVKKQLSELPNFEKCEKFQLF